jgi:hypothetical protein
VHQCSIWRSSSLQGAAGNGIQPGGPLLGASKQPVQGITARRDWGNSGHGRHGCGVQQRGAGLADGLREKWARLILGLGNW